MWGILSVFSYTFLVMLYGGKNCSDFVCEVYPKRGLYLTIMSTLSKEVYQILFFAVEPSWLEITRGVCLFIGLLQVQNWLFAVLTSPDVLEVCILRLFPLSSVPQPS